MRRAPAHAVVVEMEVPFHDVDGIHIVWHGHYLKYLEIARTALLRSRGLDVKPVIAMGYGMLVAESHVRHTFPLRYGERFSVAAWFTDLDHRIRIAYEVHNLTADRRAAKGHTILVTTDLQGRLLLETPDAIRHALAD